MNKISTDSFYFILQITCQWYRHQSTREREPHVSSVMTIMDKLILVTLELIRWVEILMKGLKRSLWKIYLIIC